MYERYVIQRRYLGMALKDTKNPLNSRNGTDITGAKKTPFCEQPYVLLSFMINPVPVRH
jgi:hypothetical protein